MEQLNKKETSLILRTCAADLTSRGGFQWPDVDGIVEVSDWKPTDECGNGAHGWLYGQGDHSCSSYLDSTAKWLVVEVESDSIVMLGGKCKFPKGIVRFVGDKHDATQYLIEHEPRAREVAVIGITVTVGDSQSAIGGALSMLTGGNGSTLTGGDGSTLTGGYGSELRIRYWDNKADRYRTVIAYVGEDGIEANVPYRLDDNHKFAKAE